MIEDDTPDILATIAERSRRQAGAVRIMGIVATCITLALFAAVLLVGGAGFLPPFIAGLCVAACLAVTLLAPRSLNHIAQDAEERYEFHKTQQEILDIAWQNVKDLLEEAREGEDR